MVPIQLLRVISTAFVLCIFCILRLTGQECGIGGITRQGYAERRVELMKRADTNSLIAMRAKDAEGEYDLLDYRQDANFLYLTGINEPGVSILLAAKGIICGGVVKSCLFFAPPASELFDCQNDFCSTTDTLLNTEEFAGIFKQSLAGVSQLYYGAPDISFVNDWLNDKPHFLITDAKKRLKQQYPGLKIKDAATLINPMRSIKSEQEIELIKSAIRMTGDGILFAEQICKPGLSEYVLQAAVEYEMIRQGAEKPAFNSIIGSGKNSLILHYNKNNCKLEKGQVVVMDVGAQYKGYAGDITRTIPVSGKFTKEQKEIYNIVLQAQKEIISIIRPGTTISELDRKATEVISGAGYKKFIRHGVTHPVGLAVHDVITSDTLTAGMIITVEPGIYIPVDETGLPEGYRGFGIRIEDDVLVTENGCEVLSKSIPKEVEEIEKAMK